MKKALQGLVSFNPDEVIIRLPKSTSALLSLRKALDPFLVEMLAGMRDNDGNTSNASLKTILAVEVGEIIYCYQ